MCKRHLLQGQLPEVFFGPLQVAGEQGNGKIKGELKTKKTKTQPN